MFGKIRRYLHNVLVGADQEANVIAGGKPDETVSSRSQRAADRGSPIGKGMTAFLRIFQRDHGHKAEAGDLRRAKDIVETETEALDHDAT